jgi:exopolysaccharide biosynthesis polyprenyl glycosylphosphotransferase
MLGETLETASSRSGVDIGAGRLESVSVSALPEAPLPPEAPPVRDERRRRVLAQVLVHAVDAIALGATAVVVLPVDHGAPVAGIVLAVLVLAPLVVCGGGTATRLTLRTLDETPRTFGWVGVGLLVAAPIALLTDTPSRLLAQAALSAVAVSVGRGATYTIIRRLRRAGHLRDRAVVVGAGVVGTELERVLSCHREFGVEVVGFVDEPLEGGPAVLGDIDTIEAILERYRISRVIVAFGMRRESELVDLMRRLGELDLDVHLVPRFFDIGVAPTGAGVDDLWGIPLYHLPRTGQRRPSWTAKRVLDVTLASVLLVLSLPLLLLLAVAVRVGSPGHPLFRQARTGRDGREFQLLKLRSLREPSTVRGRVGPPVPDGDDDLAIQMSRRIDVDQRVTWMGGFVRRTCLDEVPQLWNVVKGDMSLVGPRPEEADFADQFAETVPGYAQRHRVPGGLTGWAQVNGLRGETSIVERARFDNQYIEHWSLWSDLAILLRTAGALGRSVVGRFDPQSPPDLDPAWKARH